MASKKTQDGHANLLTLQKMKLAVFQSTAAKIRELRNNYNSQQKIQTQTANLLS